MKKIFLATSNQGKVERYKNLLLYSGLDIHFSTPKDVGLEDIQVEERGKTLAENAKIKARAYFGKVFMPILANDTGFYIEGEGLIEAPKRKALGEIDEDTLTKKEMAELLITFWKNVATKHGGSVDAAWIEIFTLLMPDGEMRMEESKREVILTNKIRGEPHIQMPVRALYISKATGKPALYHTKEEELMEMEPLRKALLKVLR